MNKHSPIVFAFTSILLRFGTPKGGELDFGKDVALCADVSELIMDEG